MKTEIFVGTADPDLGYQPRPARQFLALQALLFQRPVVQDNFLLSAVMQKIEHDDNFLSGLIGEGLLSIALRQTAGSLVEVNDRVVRDVRSGRYIPHVGDNKHTYDSADFLEFVARLNEACGKPGAVVPFRWAPHELGRKFKLKMLGSLQSPEWSTASSILLDVYSAVEARVLADTQNTLKNHSRSDYFFVGKAMFAREPAKMRMLKAWANSIYLTNLPDLHLSAWLPGKILADLSQKSGPHPPVLPIDPNIRPKILSGLLNPSFLDRVTPQGIKAARDTDQFKALQASIFSGSMKERTYDLAMYAKWIWDEAPRLIEGSGLTITDALKLKVRWTKEGDAAKDVLSPIAGACLLFVLAEYLPQSLFGSPLPPDTRFAVDGSAATLGALLGRGAKNFMDRQAMLKMEVAQKEFESVRRELELSSLYRGYLRDLYDVADWVPDAPSALKCER